MDFGDRPTYQSCRKRFLENARQAGLKIQSVQIPGQGISGEDLFQDYAYIDNNCTTTLVHMSGVHGIEGYVGSDIQSEILRQNLFENKSCNYLLIHAVNPFGMSWYRRTNGNNVDLNRSAMDRSTDKFKNRVDIIAPYLKLLASKSHFEFFILRFYKHLFRAIFVHGFQKETYAIGVGQYDHPTSLFYGGKDQQPEILQLFEQVPKIFPHSKKFVFMDIHSGLGKFANEVLMMDLNETQPVAFYSSATMPNQTVPVVADLDFYKPDGQVAEGLRKRWSEISLSYVTQEFGTIHPILTSANMTVENNMFHNGREKTLKRIDISIATFYPAKRNWRQTCLKKGLERYLQIQQVLPPKITLA